MRVVPKDHIYPTDGTGNRRALYVDVETTGLSPSKNEIFELAMVPFNYGPDGRIFELLPPFQSFQEPSGSIRRKSLGTPALINPWLMATGLI